MDIPRSRLEPVLERFVLSGVFGRYVYVRIPKTIEGGFLDLRELEARKGRIVDAVIEATGLTEPALAHLTGPDGSR